MTGEILFIVRLKTLGLYSYAKSLSASDRYELKNANVKCPTGKNRTILRNIFSVQIGKKRKSLVHHILFLIIVVFCWFRFCESNAKSLTTHLKRLMHGGQ